MVTLKNCPAPRTHLMVYLSSSPSCPAELVLLFSLLLSAVGRLNLFLDFPELVSLVYLSRRH